MSAYVVSKKHIDTLVDAACVLGLITGAKAARWIGAPAPAGEYPSAEDSCGAMLWRENERSVAARHGEEPAGLIDGYAWSPAGLDTSAGAVPPREIVRLLKALACYEYQSCEHDGWERSEARRFCEGLRHALIEKLPGYRDAPWGVD